jgi:hypothetical protein
MLFSRLQVHAAMSEAGPELLWGKRIVGRSSAPPSAGSVQLSCLTVLPGPRKLYQQLLSPGRQRFGIRLGKMLTYRMYGVCSNFNS